MDDFNLVHESKNSSRDCLAEILAKMDALGLELNKKTHIYPLSHGLKFFEMAVHALTDTGKVVRLMTKSPSARSDASSGKLKAKLEQGVVSMRDVRNNYQSWVANARRGNTRALILRMNTYYQELFGEVP